MIDLNVQVSRGIDSAKNKVQHKNLQINQVFHWKCMGIHQRTGLLLENLFQSLTAGHHLPAARSVVTPISSNEEAEEPNDKIKEYSKTHTKWIL